MKHSSKTILKNIGALMGSQAITWMLMLLLTIFLPRYLGAEAIGQLHLGMSIWMIMGVFMAFGMDTFLIKAIARDPAQAPDLLGTTLVVRAVLFILSFGIVTLYAYMAQYPTETLYIIYLVGIAQLLWQWVAACEAVLEGLETMEHISIARVVGKIINTFLGIAVLLLGYGIYTIGIVGIIAALGNLLLLFIILGRRYRLRIRIAPRQAVTMVKASASYLTIALSLVFYNQVDVIIISFLVNEQTIGWYSASDRLFSTLLFVPTIIVTAIFPMLARTNTDDPTAMPRIMRRNFDMMLLVSVPLGLGLMIIADPLVVLLFGAEFAASGPILAVMGIVLIFTYLNILLGKFMLATDRQNIWTVVMVTATVLTVPLDLVLIPWCQQMFANGAIGGALSYVVTEASMVLAGLWLLPGGALNWSNVRTAALIILAGIAMAGATWWFRDAFLAIPILVGAVTYIGLILLLRVIPREDRALLKQLAQQMLQRVRRRNRATASVGGV
jgi:O-antigen/teichoic acid export membrane protein